MPTLPLYITPNHPDASHRVTAPGGCERWTFDAHDPATDTQIFIDFFDGIPFYPRYVRRYARYRRCPTRVAPPTPSDFPALCIAIFRQNKTVFRSDNIYPSASLNASSAEFNLSLGKNHAERAVDRSYLLHLESGPVIADLRFAPRLATGQIQLGADTIRFSGDGYFDHQMSPAALSSDAQIIRGRAIFAGQTRSFTITTHRGKHDARVIATEGGGPVELPISGLWTGATRHAPSGATFPSELGLADQGWGDRLKLTNPRLLDSSPARTRIKYSATDGRHRIGGVAFCEILDLRPLRWPLIGRLFERSFNRVSV